MSWSLFGYPCRGIWRRVSAVALALWLAGVAHAQVGGPMPMGAPPGAARPLFAQGPQPGALPPMPAYQSGDIPAAPGGPMGTDGGAGAGTTSDPGADLPAGAEPAPPGSEDNFPLSLSYKYNAGGGYTSLFTKDGDYTVNLQQQVTLDGTFYDRANVGTTERGFNIPFYRAFLFGNITKDWDYQASVQAGLGSFNVLDLWLNHKFSDALNFRFGRQLTPLLYEYYGFSPAWEPVITNSPLFQVAGKRQEGAMIWGRLFDGKFQYQQGVFNGPGGAFFDLDNGVDYIGDMAVTPFKGSKSIFDSLGVGVGAQIGRHNYSLAIGSVDNFVNGAGEPTTNSAYINSTGIPFFSYIPGIIANGMQTRVAPRLFWFGRFSLLAEYLHQDRALANSANGVQVTESLNGYYVNVSYFLTGESYSGDGLAGYTTISPLRPFMPQKGCWGPGAWELAAQYAQLRLGSNVVAAGFVDAAINATRLNQTMLGVNWWMNKYTRLSFDWVYDATNVAVPIGVDGSGPLVSSYNIYWTRLAMFF